VIVFGGDTDVTKRPMTAMALLAIGLTHRSGDWRDNREIYIMNADGSNVQRLTFNEVWDSHPQW